MLFAANVAAKEHKQARTWMEAMLSSASETVGFAWLAMLGFVRVSTRWGVFAAPLSLAKALYFLEVWLSADNAHVVEPTQRHLSILKELIESTGAAGNLTNDAHLAALAIEHGAELVSFDRDFLRFEGLRANILKA
jgi:uncharacterized protein